MFFSFSSAINTTQPILLGDKISAAQVDTALASWIIDYLKEEYRSLIDNFVERCECSHAMREMVFNFCKSPPAPVIIEGENIKVVQTYKYCTCLFTWVTIWDGM